MVTSSFFNDVEITDIKKFINALNKGEDKILFTKIARAIKAKRKSCGYSKKEFAQKLGVSKKKVIKWENGEKTIKFKVLRKMCAALGLKLQIVFD